MSGVHSPAIRRRELGERLRAHRLGAGLTADEVADRLFVSTPKISRIETARRGVSLRDVRDLAALYGLPQAETDELMQMARESQARSQWQKYSSQISDYAELEVGATSVSDYETSVIPALLQSRRYAQALAVGFAPQATAVLHERAVEARLARQALARQRGTQMNAVIDESAMRRMVGGRDVMQEQMEALKAAAQFPNTTVQVIPFNTGAHPGMDSTFIIMQFSESVSSVVYVEGLIGSIYLRSSTDVDRYQQVFTVLQRIAASPADTLDMILSYEDYYRS